MAVELYISADDHGYMKAAIKKASTREVGFLGIVETNEEAGTGLVKHLRILKQKVSSGEVDFSDEAFADYLEWLYTPVGDEGAGFEGTEYGLYSAHSHGSMGVFFSGTDEEAIKKYGMSAPWVFSSVFNTKNESKHRLDVFKEINGYCPLIPNGQITFNGGKLWVLPHPNAQPVLNEINKTKKEAEDKIEAIEKERDQTIEALDSSLEEATKGVLAGIGSRMEDDWDEYVESSWSGGLGKGKKTSSSTGGTGGKGKASSNTSRTQQSQSSSGGSHRGSSGKEGGGANGVAVNHNTIMNYIYHVYDSGIQGVYGATLETILGDDNLILLETIEEFVLRLLYEDEIKTLAKRDHGNFSSIEEAIEELTGAIKEVSESTTEEEIEEIAYKLLQEEELSTRQLSDKLGISSLPNSITKSDRIEKSGKKVNKFPVLRVVKEKEPAAKK